MSRQTDKFNELQKKLHRCKRLKSLTHIQKVKKIDTIWEEQAKTADPDEFQSILQQYSNPHDTTQKDITSFFKPLQSFDKQRLNQWHRLNHNSPAPNTPSRKATQPKYNSPAPNTPSRKATPSRKYNTPKPMRRRQAASARKYQTPRQDKIASEIKSKRDNIAKEREFIRLLSTFRESDDYKHHKAEHKRLVLEENELVHKLQSMQRHTANMKAYRHRKRQAEKEVKSRGIIKDYPYHEKSGRPRIEEYERGKDLAATMQRVADTNSSTDARRRTENVQVNFSARSFAKKVNEDIEAENINVAQANIHYSTVYRRTANRRKNTVAARRHNTTTKIKFRTPAKSHRDPVKSAHFCLALRKNVDTYCAINGPKYVIYIELDDKAKAPVGVTLVNKQKRLVTGCQFVRLKDHDFPCGPRQYLHVSVYRIYAIATAGHVDDHRRISWTGPTMVFIRSGYHEAQSAFNHAQDVARILEDERFNKWTRVLGGDDIKPILHLAGDTGPDEAARNDKVQLGGLWLMNKFQFDTIIHRNSPENWSAMNRIERAMKILTDCFCGKELPIDTHGSHLTNGEVTNESLCLKNMNESGRLLCKNINNTSNDGYPVYAEYIEPLMGDELVARDKEFYDLNLLAYQTAQHCVTSGYFYQYKQCLRSECDYCTKTKFMSQLPLLFPKIFIPPPIVVDNNNGFALVDREKLSKMKKYHFCGIQLQQQLNLTYPKAFSFDHYNLRYGLKQLSKRFCPFCGMEFASAAKMLRHKRHHHFRKRKSKRKGGDEDEKLHLDIESLQKKATVVKVIRESQSAYLCLLDDDSTKWMHYDESFSSKVEEYKAQMEEYNTTNKLDEHGFIVITADNYCDFYTHPLADMLTQYDSDEDVCDGLDKYHVDKNKSKRKNKRKRSRKQMLNDSGTDEELQGMQRKRRRIYFGPKTDKREMDHSEDDDDNKTDGSSDDDVPIELLSVPAVNGDKSDEGSSDDDVPIGGYLSKPAVNGNKTDESSSDDDEPII